MQQKELLLLAESTHLYDLEELIGVVDDDVLLTSSTMVMARFICRPVSFDGSSEYAELWNKNG